MKSCRWKLTGAHYLLTAQKLETTLVGSGNGYYHSIFHDILRNYLALI